jgi:VanZ family protein
VSVIGEERAPVPQAEGRRAGLTAGVATWAPVAAWVTIIFSLSSDRFSDTNTAAWMLRFPFIAALGLPPNMLAAANVIVRKCAHFVEYAVLSALTFRAVRTTWPRRTPAQLVLLVVAVAVACATLDELRQYLLTVSRNGTPKDVVLDVVGASAGAVVVAAYLYRRPRRRAA